jgi:pimeloyl-ACP methyl ester carboxylesterase
VDRCTISRRFRPTPIAFSASFSTPSAIDSGASDEHTIARRFAPRLPNAELVIIPDAEHAPWLDDLDMCVARTQSFLAR